MIDSCPGKSMTFVQYQCESWKHYTEAICPLNVQLAAADQEGFSLKGRGQQHTSMAAIPLITLLTWLHFTSACCVLVLFLSTYQSVLHSATRFIFQSTSLTVTVSIQKDLNIICYNFLCIYYSNKWSWRYSTLYQRPTNIWAQWFFMDLLRDSDIQ